MISETEFAELSNSLSTGFFADKVVLALARTQRLGRLQDRDVKTIKEASRLLGQIIKGEQWLQNKKLDTKSAESALAFDRAVHALPWIGIPSEFVDYIKQLQRTVNKLLKEGSASTESIQKVRGFFFGFARAVSIESQRVIESPSEPQGIMAWNHYARGTT